jgi:hypothetical protein
MLGACKGNTMTVLASQAAPRAAIMMDKAEEPSNTDAEVDRAREKYPSRPIDMNRGSIDPAIREAVNEVYETINVDGRFSSNRECPIKSHLNVVLCNLMHVHEQLPGHWIRYSRSSNDYRCIDRYHPFGKSYRHMLAVIDGLESVPFIGKKIGFNNRETGKRFQTRIRAKPNLIHLLKHTFNITPEIVQERPYPEIIVLRDHEKFSVDYEDTEETDRMRSEAKTYNDHLSNHEIILGIPTPDMSQLLEKNPVDFTNRGYRRVFNNSSFDNGGRFYGPWWQNLKSILRPFITIDGQPITYLDYSAMHVHLLYSKEGLSFHTIHGEGVDPYSIEGGDCDQRKVLKKILLIALNCTERRAAFGAMRNELRDEGLYTVGMDLPLLMEQFSEKHRCIAHHLYSGIGLYLQRRESIISEYVIRNMVSQDIPTLNIHDGFLTQVQHDEALREVMARAFVSNDFESIPLIKKEF